MKQIGRLIALLALSLMVTVTYAATASLQVYPATTLIEQSPEIGAIYHQLVGKIASAFPTDNAMAEKITGQLVESLEASVPDKPTTYDDAVAVLLKRLQWYDEKFEAYKAKGALEAWVIEAQSSSTKLAVPVVASPQSENKNAQAGPSTMPPQTPALMAPSAESESQLSRGQTNLALFVTVSALTLVVMVLAWRLYPKFFMSSIDFETSSKWEILKRRGKFALIVGVVTLFGLAYAADELVRKLF